MLTGATARCTSWRPCAQPQAGAGPALPAARCAVLHPSPRPAHAAHRQRRRVATGFRDRGASDSSSSVVLQNEAADAAPGSALKVVVVGAGPVGLAAAAALARQAGADVVVHDSRRDPRSDQQHKGDGTLVALGKRGLQALEDLQLSAHGPEGANARGDSTTTTTTTSSAPLPGLSLLQGLAVVGPQGGVTQELFVSRSTPRSSGIAAIAESGLTDHLLALATAGSKTAGPDARPSLISGAQVTAAAVADAAAARPGSTTPLPQGPALAPSAEAAQLAAMPDTIIVPDTADASRDETPCSSVSVRYHSQLVLVDTANKQATFLGEGGEAHVAAFDLLIAADAGSSAQLVSDTLLQLEQRQAAHKHPSAATSSSNSSSSAASQAGVEAEWMAWQDMPNEPSLAHLLSRGAGDRADSASEVSSTDRRHPSGPTRGWLLAWRGSRATGTATAAIPGARGCTVLAWPSVTGAAWSGCVLADPQIFEALRGKADYEQLLRGLSGPGTATTRLPGPWVDSIAQQLARHQGRIGRARAASEPPPAHLSAPAAGLLTLSSAVVPAAPQLLNPALSLGLAEVASLVSALQEAAGKPATASVLQQFDRQHQPDAAALHNLLAQLSWLRHAHSPARAAAAASVTWGSLAWLVGGLLRAPRAGLVLQWRCLATLLPLVAAAHKLGLGGRPDKHAPPRLAATTVSPAHSLPAVLEASEPCGSSLAALLHTTDVRPGTLWRLLQWAPLLLATLWGAALFFLALALRWSMWALRACGWATSGVA